MLSIYNIIGLRATPKFLFQELTSTKERRRHLNSFNSAILSYIKQKFNITFVSETSIPALIEIFIQDIYTKFDHFIEQNSELVIDVGAQHGDFAILCTKVLGARKVISFEPIIENVNIFKKNVEANEMKNFIEIIPKCVSDSDTFKTGEKNGNMIVNNGCNTVTMDSVTIDSLNLKAVDLIKIDAEGFENEVIIGAKATISQFRPKLIIESHTRKNKEFLLNELMKLGYKVRHESEITHSEVPWFDDVQILFFSV